MGLYGLLLVQMFPVALAFVAIFIMVDQFDDTFPAIGTGSIIAIMLFYLGGALGANAWLIKGFFDTIPKDLDESAQMDGATHNQTFFKIILPLAAPVLAIIFLLAFISAQAEFLIAQTILFGLDTSSPDLTVAVGLRGLLAGDRYDLRWGPFAMGALLAAIPVVLLFQFLQRYIVGGSLPAPSRGDSAARHASPRRLRTARLDAGARARRHGVGVVARPPRRPGHRGLGAHDARRRTEVHGGCRRPHDARPRRGGAPTSTCTTR